MNSGSTYSFRAVHPDGKLENGLIEAASREAAVALLGGRGIYPIEVSHRANTIRARARAGFADIALGLRALASLLEAGLPISRALAVVEDLAPACWTAVLPRLKNRIEQGDSLAAALRDSMLPLPTHVLGIIEAGEAGGGLAAAVSTAAELVENRSATTAALWNALSYPIVLAVTGTASIALLMGIVLPRFAELMADAGQTLPLVTRLVLGINAAVQVGALPGLLAAAVSLSNIPYNPFEANSNTVVRVMLRNAGLHVNPTVRVQGWNANLLPRGGR